VSYPLYALHWAFWYVMISIYPNGWKRDLPLWFCVLAFFVLPAASWAAWRWVETPLRTWLKRATHAL
jgi:peptidoglycan/LPS O-acetylase OafA/YrhL